MSSLSIFFIFKNRETDAPMIMKVILMEPEHEWTLLAWVYSSTPSGESQVLLLLAINFKDYDLTNKGPENLKKKVCLLVLSWVNNNKKTHFVENISWMISTSGISELDTLCIMKAVYVLGSWQEKKKSSLNFETYFERGRLNEASVEHKWVKWKSLSRV